MAHQKNPFALFSFPYFFPFHIFFRITKDHPCLRTQFLQPTIHDAGRRLRLRRSSKPRVPPRVTEREACTSPTIIHTTPSRQSLLTPSPKKQAAPPSNATTPAPTGAKRDATPTSKSARPAAPLVRVVPSHHPYENAAMTSWPCSSARIVQVCA